MKFNGADIEVVWVDLDDTIIDFTANARLALTAMWRDEQVLRRLFDTPDFWAECYERYNMALWAQYNIGEISREYLRMERFRRPLVEAGLVDNAARELSQRYDTLYLDYLALQKTLMPGAMQFMHWLRKQQVRVGCLSNGFKEVQFRKIHRAGLDGLFDLVVLSDDIGVNKPDPRIYAYAMERSGVLAPAAHLMIGDNPQTDIAGALAVGWGAIWYNTMRIPGSSTPPHAIEVRHLKEIENIL